jgi:aspartate aminotransferase
MTFSENIARLRPSATIAVSTLAKELRAQGRDIINLSAGEPDFDTPEWISDAAVEGIRAGATRYTPAPGLPELRVAVARSLGAAAAPGWDLAADGVVVTSGAKQALFNACFTLFGPGDEVLVAAPYWTSYPEIVGLARAEPRFVSGAEERGFRLTPGELDRVRTDRTRGLILCSPSNPTGSVYSLDELAEVAEWCRENQVWILSDEIYRRIWFSPDGKEGATAPGLLQLPRSRVGPWVVIDGLSKSHAMTGWRIGYAVADPEVARKMGALQSHTTSNAATPSQMAALAALTRPEQSDRAIAEMVKAFRRRRDLVVARIRERLPHLSFVEPQGAFYLFLRVDGEFDDQVADSEAWCARVLEETGVAMVPGAAFGDDRFARLSYATSDDLLEEAIRRLAEERQGVSTTPAS